MIREITCDINSIMMNSGFVNTHFEYCELIKNGDVTYPAQYDSGGNYVQVFNNDVGGNSYLRRNGKASFSSVSGVDNVKFIACGDNPFVKMTLPFRLVMTVPKSALLDDAFSDDLLAMSIINLITADTVVAIDGVRLLQYNVLDYDTDALSIWSAEVKGMDYQMNFAYSFVALNFNAVAIVNPNCLNFSCNAY